MWLARDKKGNLNLFSNKPVLEEESIWVNPQYGTNEIFTDFDCEDIKWSHVEIDKEAFPEVTFENSPKELVIK